MKTICALTLAAGLTYSTPSFTLDFCEGSNKEEWGNCYGDLPFENGDFYIGDINQGLSEGRGIYKFADGTYYEGQWANDKRSGYGSLIFNDGKRITGQWQDNTINGKATFTSENGNNWTGMWEQGSPIGVSIEELFGGPPLKRASI